ncbi:MAG: FtsQ-type POTRA domain-containing protein [Desulfomonilaceae bacterium]
MAEKRRPLIIDRKPRRADFADPVGKRKRNRTFLKSLLMLGLTVDSILALFLLYMLFLHMPYFKLQEVDVTGNRRLSRAEVIEASEIEDGINLLTVDLNAIASRLRRHPWIRFATVYRRFPGKLILEIEERTPRAILAAGKLYYVDEQAELFTRLLPGDSVNFPLFTGVTPEELKTNGSKIQEMVRMGFGVLDLIERTGSEPDSSGIAEIQMNLNDGLSLHTRAGRVLVLGKGDFEIKIQRYERLKRFLTQRGEWNNARIINLDFEDRALVRSGKTRLQG